MRRVHRDEHVVRLHVGLELRAHLQDQLDLGLGLLLHHRAQRERRLERRRDAVVHRRELALGRVEAEQALRVELVQLHAAVEVDVVQHDEVLRRQRAARRVLHVRQRAVLPDHRVLRQQHAHRRAPAQVRAHADAAVDRLRDHLAVQVHHAVQALEHVHVQLVHLLLLVAVRNHRLVHVADHALLGFNEGRKECLGVSDDDGLVVDVVGQHLARCVLRIAKVLAVKAHRKSNDGLIQQLVDQGEVLANSFLREHTAVILDNLENAVQDLHAESRRHVHLRLRGDVGNSPLYL